MAATNQNKESMKAAQQGDTVAREDACWTLSARPCSVEEDEHALLASMACSTLQYGSQQLQLAITASTDWTPADLAKLETLVQSRNRFVCMQLVTMAKEQYSKVKTAEAAGDASLLHTARFMYLGTVTVADSNEVVAAGIFYPRSRSKDQVEMPHIYVELICCNSPGKGYGTVLLQHIEQFTAGCCEYLSAGFFGSLQPVEGNCESTELESHCGTGAVAAGQPGNGVVEGIVLPLVGMHAAVPVGGVSDACCTACSSEGCIAASAVGLDVMMLPVPQGFGEAAVLQQSPGAGGLQSQPIDIPARDVSTTATCDGSAGLSTSVSSISSCCSKKSNSSPAKRIQGIKLISVASAQSFYERNGYGAPDVCKEMFKPLICCGKRAGLGDGGSVAGSSCSSIAMSIC